MQCRNARVLTKKTAVGRVELSDLTLFLLAVMTVRTRRKSFTAEAK